MEKRERGLHTLWLQGMFATCFLRPSLKKKGKKKSHFPNLYLLQGAGVDCGQAFGLAVILPEWKSQSMSLGTECILKEKKSSYSFGFSRGDWKPVMPAEIIEAGVCVCVCVCCGGA